ncbi:hypothetical protein G6F35_016486 [Rhizopus arrhizus]|nr:hypothetical protein G6F35_016486 [Rhizopus arrhizus]
MALVFTSPSSGYRHNGIGEPEPLWVDRSAEQTRLVMLDDGVAEPIRISADGQRIEDSVTVVYTLRQSRACTAEPSAVAGSCRAAGSYCMVQLPTASPGQARRACDESPMTQPRPFSSARRRAASTPAGTIGRPAKP